MSSARTIVRQRYRSLSRLVKRLPERTGLSSSSSRSAYRCPEESWRQLRTSFREPLGVNESIEDRIKKADERLSFLKMITPKLDHSSSNAGVLLDNTNEGGGRWIYKNGKRIEGGSGTVRDSKGRVISNWDGKNLDPDNVKQHNRHLKRMGYRNNAHAKGIF